MKNKKMVQEKKEFIGNPSLPQTLQSPEVRADNKAELENFPMVINTQKAVYETLIADLRNRIDRTEERNQFLEQLRDTMKIKESEQIAQTENEVVELNVKIVNETKKIEQLRGRIEDLNKSGNASMNAHKEKVQQINETFEKTRVLLYSEIKHLYSKINAIEAYKADEGRLKEKFNNNAKYIADQEEEMSKELGSIQLKARQHKENLKKESYDQILVVSGQFQQMLKETIPQTLQRLMRENIVLENELVRLWNDQSMLEDLRAGNVYRVTDYKDSIEEHKKQEKQRIVTIKIQHLILKKAREVHGKAKKALEKSYKNFNNFNDCNYEKLLEELKNKENTSENIRKRNLEVLLHRESIKRSFAKAFESKTALAVNNCCKTLDILKKAINTAVNKEETDKNLTTMNLDQLAGFFLDLINQFDAKKCIFATKSLETVGKPEDAYSKGDLGFDPKYIEFEDKICKKIEEIRSVKSESDILKELENLTIKLSEKKSDKSEESISGDESISSEAGVSKESMEEGQKTTSDEHPSSESAYENEMKGYYDDDMYFD